MSNVVKPRFHRPLPGGGRDSNGNPVQGKVEVRGVIEVSSATQGESLTPADLGLSTIDWIDLSPEAPVRSASGAGETLCLYDYGAQEFYTLEDGDSTAPTGQTFNVRYNAFGDSARAPELK